MPKILVSGVKDWLQLTDSDILGGVLFVSSILMALVFPNIGIFRERYFLSFLIICALHAIVFVYVRRRRVKSAAQGVKSYLDKEEISNFGSRITAEIESVISSSDNLSILGTKQHKGALSGALWRVSLWDVAMNDDPSQPYKMQFVRASGSGGIQSSLDTKIVSFLQELCMSKYRADLSDIESAPPIRKQFGNNGDDENQWKESIKRVSRSLGYVQKSTVKARFVHGEFCAGDSDNEYRLILLESEHVPGSFEFKDRQFLASLLKHNLLTSSMRETRSSYSEIERGFARALDEIESKLPVLAG